MNEVTDTSELELVCWNILLAATKNTQKHSPTELQYRKYSTDNTMTWYSLDEYQRSKWNALTVKADTWKTTTRLPVLSTDYKTRRFGASYERI